MCVISAALPLFFTALTLSPPPMIDVPPFALTVATASHTPNVPFASGANSKQPIGPFHTTVLAPLIASEKSATDLGPMSRPIQPSSMSPSTTFVWMSLASFVSGNLSATTESTGSRNLTPFACAASSISFA